MGGAKQHEPICGLTATAPPQANPGERPPSNAAQRTHSLPGVGRQGGHHE